MRRTGITSCVVLLLAAQCAATLNAAEKRDLTRGVPEDVYLVMQQMHNPERDYQKKYLDEVWKTVQDTEIIEDVLKIITSRMGEDQLAQAEGIIAELQEATSPLDLQALANCEEFIYAQQMEMWSPEEASPLIPSSQHLALARLTPDAAASVMQTVKNLFALVDKYSDGKVRGEETHEGDAVIVTLAMPSQFPMQPVVAQLGDVVLFSTSPDLLQKSLAMMAGGEGKSKFDDPRLVATLQKLPPAEDAIVFYDGRTQFAAMRQLGTSLKKLGGEDENVQRVAKMIDMLMDELSVFDYEVTVAYTEGNLNRTASYGKMVAGTEGRMLRNMLDSGQPFENWQSWVPAGSLGYSLGTGANLHVLYEWVMNVLNEEVPESAPYLQQFEQIQEQVDLHLDRDILQAFSGEYASISVMTDQGKRESVTALRCHNPDRIQELIHRGIDALQQIDALKAQQIKLVESADLEGFEDLSAMMLMLFGARPVIGFQDGWMYIGQSADAVKKVLATKAGEGETVVTTDEFQRLAIEIEGPVQSVRYANTAENTRATADMLEKVGLLFPMIVGMAGANAEDKSLEPVKEALALLPDVAQIVRKFDFLEATITVVQHGNEPDTFTKRSVTVVRPVDEEVEVEVEEVEVESATN